LITRGNAKIDLNITRDDRILETRVENALGRGQLADLEVMSMVRLLQPVNTINWKGYGEEYAYCKLTKVVAHFDDFTYIGHEFVDMRKNNYHPVVTSSLGAQSVIWHKASTPDELKLKPYMFSVQAMPELDIKTMKVRRGLRKKMVWYPRSRCSLDVLKFAELKDNDRTWHRFFELC
jgi:hypothetical protein